LQEKYGEEYQHHKRLLFRAIGGKSDKRNLEKTNPKTRGGERK